MVAIVRKYVSSGHGNLKQRLHIKAFNNLNDAGAFLGKQTDNTWQLAPAEYVEAQKLPLKSGVYAFAGGQWHNVKSLDSSVLAHI